MSLNSRMHPRNPFKNNPPDFANLAKLYPEFASHCRLDGEKCTIDFTNANVLRSLCCTLMKDLFNYDIEIPIDHLIPRIPQRLNYVLWIEDLLKQPVVASGIDIGCGSSCIFSLLICGLNKQWKMLASDISDENLSFAKCNLNKNNLESRIKIIKVRNDTILNDLFKNTDETDDYDFLMCNPPFYSSESELQGNMEKIRKPEKRHLPNSINTGQLHESVFSDGGEVGFIKKMIDESIQIGKKIRIYTTMLGRKKSLAELKKYLIEEKIILNVNETEFYQGHTMRWGLCWSFDESLNLQTVQEKRVNKVKNNSIKFEIKNEFNFKEENKSKQFYEKFFKDLFHDDLKFEFVQEKNQKLKFIAYENTWSNQRQKRRNESKNKKSRLSDDHNQQNANANTQAKREKLIEFTLEVKESGSDYFLDFKSPDICQSKTRETLNQILQYVRNKLINK